LQPLIDAGSGSGLVCGSRRGCCWPDHRQLNDLFGAEMTEGDKLVYVNNVIMGKLMESETLREQAANNSKEQFANSPDLSRELRCLS